MRSPHIKNVFMFFYWLAMVSTFILHLYCMSFLVIANLRDVYYLLPLIKKMGQLLFILGSTLDLRSLEIHQKRLRNVMCSNFSKNQLISPHHVLLLKRLCDAEGQCHRRMPNCQCPLKPSATTAMSYIRQISDLAL